MDEVPEDHNARVTWMVANAAECDHLLPEDAKRLLASNALYSWFDDDGGYGPEHSATAFVASDGEFGVFIEGEDSTGHGCICNASVTWFSTLDEAIEKGLNVDERNEFLRLLKEQRG